MMRALGLALLLLVGCAEGSAGPSRPCFTIKGDSELRPRDANRTLEELVKRIKLAPEDEALRDPKSIADVKAILHRDTVYLFAAGAAYARTMNTLDGRVAEAQLELLLGESQLIASQVLSTQEAWLGGDLRIARAALAGEGKEPKTDRGRMLAQLIRVVEEGNKVSDALGVVAPQHLTRGAEVVEQLRKEAPTDLRVYLLVAEYHRLRGEWPEFEAAMKNAEALDRQSQALCYLRGMEQLERYRKPEEGTRLLRACLVTYPKLVRAQAGIVLMTTSPAAALTEIDKLKTMNEDHYLITLLEPTLAADQELWRMSGGTAQKPEVER